MPTDPYDELPYPCRPKARCHPDAIGAAAVFAGADPVDPATARVLELGCADGANLIPIAARAPDCQAVGIERSAVQARLGQVAVDVLGLKNLEIRQQDLREVPLSGEPFDYIIAEGVYSWVAPDVRRRVLEICAKRLSDRGLAVISYNAYPGWGVRGQLRRALLSCAPLAARASDRVAAARSALTALTELAAEVDHAQARALSAEAEEAQSASDSHLLHDLLEEHNEAFTLSQFVANAADAGLSFVTDLSLRHDRTHGPLLRQAFAARGVPPAALDGFVDLLMHRALRCAVLAKHVAPTDLEAAFARVHLRAAIRPVQGPLSMEEGVEATFVTGDGARLVEKGAWTKSVLVTLAEAWPGSVDWPMLVESSSARLSAEPSPDAQRTLIQNLELMRIVGALNVHLKSIDKPGQLASSRIAVDPLTRFEAERHDWVSGVTHDTLPIDAFDKALIRMLDGTREPSAVTAAIFQMVRSDQLGIRHEGVLLKDPDRIGDLLPQIIEAKVASLSLFGLLRVEL